MAAIVLKCAHCHRIRDDEGQTYENGQWLDVTTYMAKHYLKPSDFALSDAYCDECSVFYRQLMTYGQCGRSLTGWTVHGPFAA